MGISMLVVGIITEDTPTTEETMTNEDKPLDQRAREAEQFTFDFGKVPQAQPPKTDYAPEKTCNRAGYCYCPKCNPR